MKVLVIQDYLRCGGTVIQSIALAEGFLQYGWESSLLTFRPGGSLAHVAMEKGFMWNYLQKLIDLKLNWYAPGLVKYIHKLAPDLLLLMGREANSKASLLRKHFPQLPIIGTFRTGRTVPDRYSKSLSVCNHVVANSAWASEKVRKLGVVEQDRLSVILNGVIHPFNHSNRDKLRAEVRAGRNLSDTTAFLMVASFRKGKNHTELFRIFKNFPGKWELWLVGEGPDKRAFLKTLNNFKFRDQVKDFGQISKLESLYFAADVGILPSREESLPNFLIECQMSGLPVIAYDCAGVGETFDDQKTGILIRQGDTEGFRDQLLNLMEDENLRSKMSKEARAWAVERFDPKKRLQDWVNLIESVIN